MWIRALALAVLALVLAPVAYGLMPLLGAILVLVGGGAFVWTVALVLLPRMRPRDRYDLGELRKVHHDEEMRALDPEGALGDPEKVVCSRCFTEYPYRARACPRCGAGG